MRRLSHHSSVSFLFAVAIALMIASLYSADRAESGRALAVGSCTSVGGAVTGDTSWQASSSPYCVDSSVVVDSGAQLTIEPGVEVRFSAGSGLQVDGTLVARGTLDSPITFTSNQATPAKGDWVGIRFTEGSLDAAFDAQGQYVGGSVIQFAKVEYAGGPLSLPPADRPSAVSAASSPLIDHLTVRHNAGGGVGVGLPWYYNGNLAVTNSLIVDNEHWGIGCGYAPYSVGNILLGGNTVRQNAGGILCGSSHHGSGGVLTIKDNIISDNAAYGIQYSTTGYASLVVTGNRISGNTSGGAYLSHPGTVSLLRNTVADNQGTGITIDIGFPRLIMGNLISGNGNGGLGLYTCYADTVISRNTITGNTSAGTWAGLIADCPNNVHYNNLYENTAGSPGSAADLAASPLVPVNAENNYWGTSDPNVIATRVSQSVDYTPFLDAPIDIGLPTIYLPLVAKD